MSAIEICSMFQGIHDVSRMRIKNLIEHRPYTPGAFIFQAGDPANHFYFLEEGRVRLRFSHGGQVAYTLNEPGDVFGWSSMVNQSQYTLSAQCVSQVRVARMCRDELSRILESDPATGMIFYRGLAALITERLLNSYKATVFVHGERSSLSYG